MIVLNILKTNHYIIYLVRPLHFKYGVIVDQAQTNYHGRPMMLEINQSGVTELLIMSDPHCGLVGSVLSWSRPFPQLRM